MNRMLYLGVEGGASKSEALLVDASEKILGQTKGDALNLASEGKLRFTNNLSALLAPLFTITDNLVTKAAFGLSGVDTDYDVRAYTNIITSVVPTSIRVCVTNDAITALEAKCPNEKDRMLLISGTGSSVYGESGEKHAKAIGWNYILGDQGSGYDAGLKVLKAVTSAWDGRGEKTLLETLVMEKLGARTFEDVVAKTYVPRVESNNKYYIASFAQLLDTALAQHDSVASNIRIEVAQELQKGVIAVAKRLDVSEKAFILGFVGSTLSMQGLLELLKSDLRRVFPLIRFSTNKEKSIWGAIRLAQKIRD